ncbi:MAG: NUDIX domain-containing protein [Balneolaceae bacterium]
MNLIDAAGGVLYKKKGGRLEVLLIFRRNVWDLPKGKKEDSETFEECAVREVSEEVGTEQLILGRHLLDTYHEYRRDGILLGKTTRWYAMQLGDIHADLRPQKDEGIEKLLWQSVTKAKEQVGFDNLINVLETFERFV